MKNRKFVLLSLAMVVIMLFSACFVYGEDEKKPSKPEIQSESAAVYCVNTESFVFKKKQSKKLNPYSITKVMTAWLASEELPLNREVVISRNAASQGGKVIGLKEGEVVTVENLLYAALLESGNDAAYALGEAVSGNMENFVKLMNKRAIKIGCMGTMFSNPSGMKEKNHYSTAADMARIAAWAFSDETVAKIAGTAEYHMAADNMSDERILKNGCFLVRNNEDENNSNRVIAAKKGVWDDEHTLVTVYKKHGVTYSLAIMNSTKKAVKKDAPLLMDYSNGILEKKLYMKAGQKSGKVRIKNGASNRVKAITKKDIYLWFPPKANEEMIKEERDFKNNLKAPVKKGEKLGNLKVYIGKEQVFEIELVADDSVKVGWPLSRFGISNAGGITLLILVITAILLILRMIKLKNRRRDLHLRKKEKIMEIARRELKNERKI